MSVFRDIMDALETAVNGMTTPTFNSNWSNTNEWRPANRTYPACEITIPEEVAEDPDDSVIDSYSAKTDVIFKVTVDDTFSDVDVALDNALEDIKRLMEQEHADLQVEGMVYANSVGSTKQYTNTRKRPGIITITFNIFYRVRRSDPSVTT